MFNSQRNLVFTQTFRCAKDIDTLIESLPNEDSSQELQAQSLRHLEIENQEAAKRLEEVKYQIKLILSRCLCYFKFYLFSGCRSWPKNIGENSGCSE